MEGPHSLQNYLPSLFEFSLGSILSLPRQSIWRGSWSPLSTPNKSFVSSIEHDLWHGNSTNTAFSSVVMDFVSFTKYPSVDVFFLKHVCF